MPLAIGTREVSHVTILDVKRQRSSSAMRSVNFETLSGA